MGKFKRILHRLIFPGTFVVLLSVPVAAALLAYAFLATDNDSLIAYVSYIISAYSLTIVCANVVPLIRKGRQWVHQNPFMSRYLNDIPFKLLVSLHLSLIINLLYAGINALSGIIYHSVWFGTLAAYYIFLAIMRYLLIRYAHKNGLGSDKVFELKRYRVCGIVLMTMNITLAGVVVLVLRLNKGFHYTGFLIYAMALYTFYTTIIAIINVIRNRQYQSPVMSAARAVSLAAALVSMLSLETAMLTQFGGGEYFRRIMIASTGGAVCAAIVGMGIYMIVHSTLQLRTMKKS